MIRRFLLLVSVLCLAACGGAEKEWPPASPALWEVTRPDGAKGWLFGTVHALPRGVEWRTATLDKALASADLLVLEVADLNDRDAAAIDFERVAYSSGLPPLSSRVPPADRSALEDFLDRAGMDDGDFAQLETWAAALQLANATRSSDSGEGVDRALLDDKEQVIGLESFAAQYRVFDELSPQDQADLLLLLAQDAELEANDERLRAWAAGDLERLAKQSAAGILSQARLREALLTARNRLWAERINKLLASGHRPFVAVGAAHMFWKDGLPELLAARGYDIRRIQ